MSPRSVTFEILGERASPMSNPTLRIHWHPGQQEHPKQYAEWPDTLDRWIKIVQRHAEKAMRYEHELFRGSLRVDITLHWQRPQSHYHASGAIRSEYIDDLPTQDPLTIETARGIAWAMERIVYYSRDQINQPIPLKIWAQPHQGHKLTITVTQITARDVDPWAAAQPEQQELF